MIRTMGILEDAAAAKGGLRRYLAARHQPCAAQGRYGKEQRRRVNGNKVLLHFATAPPPDLLTRSAGPPSAPGSPLESPPPSSRWPTSSPVSSRQRTPWTTTWERRSCRRSGSWRLRPAAPLASGPRGRPRQHALHRGRGTLLLRLPAPPAPAPASLRFSGSRSGSRRRSCFSPWALRSYRLMMLRALCNGPKRSMNGAQRQARVDGLPRAKGASGNDDGAACTYRGHSVFDAVGSSAGRPATKI